MFDVGGYRLEGHRRVLWLTADKDHRRFSVDFIEYQCPANHRVPFQRTKWLDPQTGKFAPPFHKECGHIDATGHVCRESALLVNPGDPDA